MTTFPTFRPSRAGQIVTPQAEEGVVVAVKDTERGGSFAHPSIGSARTASSTANPGFLTDSEPFLSCPPPGKSQEFYIVKSKTVKISLSSAAFLGGFLAVMGSSLSAAVLDWSMYRSPYTASPGPYTDPAGLNPWAFGALSKTLVNVNSTGVDVKVTVTGATANFVSNSLGAAPQVSHLSWNPANSDLFDGDPDGNPMALVLNLDHSLSDWSESVTVKFEYFKTGTSNLATVQNVSFQIYDIDFNSADSGSTIGYIDEVRNFNSTFNGTTATNDASLTATGANVFKKTTGPTLYGQGGNFESTANGHGTIDYGAANLMSSMEFTYGNYNVFDSGTRKFTETGSPFKGLVASNQPVQQFIGIGNINFTATPEAGTMVGFAAALGCAGMMLRRRK